MEITGLCGNGIMGSVEQAAVYMEGCSRGTIGLAPFGCDCANSPVYCGATTQ